MPTKPSEGSRNRAGRHDEEFGFDLSPNAHRVLEARYLKRDADGRCVETPHDLFVRVATAIAQAELLYGGSPVELDDWKHRFYNLMTSLRFLPNSPTLMNAGREMGMLSACFVLPVGDSIAEIFDSIKNTALIQKAGGGTGLAFDRLRPTGDFIQSSGGTSSGPISFWRAFCEASNAIQQGAFRRAANMGMMYVDHPDILKFLCAKQDLTRFTNYNISVKVTDRWMQELRTDPVTPHVVTNPRTGRLYFIPREVEVPTYTIRDLVSMEAADLSGRAFYSRRDVWDLIVRNAWETGEPGIVFIDRVNEHNPTPYAGRIEATNPCGEQPLLDFEACNLGSVNLTKYIVAPGIPEARVDWDGLGETVEESLRFLDNVIDVNKFPLSQIDDISKGNRKVGLGVMGFADALFMLSVPYNSSEGVAWGERFMQFINERAHAASEKLADKRGSFPNWAGSTWDTRHDRPMRNACCTSVAPTGTISIIAGCTAGIEPLYALAFKRTILKEQHFEAGPMLEVNRAFMSALENAGLTDQQLIDRVTREGAATQVVEIPEAIRRVFVTSHDIAPEWHVRMQAAFQKYCDASVSKTINLPRTATKEDVEMAFQLAFDLACKGVTVYRDGCRDDQPMDALSVPECFPQ